MKIAHITLLFLLVPLVINIAQDSRPGERGIHLQRIEQMENAKLIQELDLKEEEAVRFFARRKEYREKNLKYSEQRRELMKKISEQLDDNEKPNTSDCKENLNKLFELEGKIVKETKEFYKSLWKILTPKQICKLIVFEDRFRREIRESLIRKMQNNRGE